MTEHRNITDTVKKPKKQVSMNSTKEPLYKKKYHAAHQLYPKIMGVGEGEGGEAQLCTPLGHRRDGAKPTGCSQGTTLTATAQ